MGQCFSSTAQLDTPERFKNRWQQGGLGDGLSAFDGKYGALDAVQPAYTTTADVGMKARDYKFSYMHENGKTPAPLQLDRIEEDNTLQGECSPLKPTQLVMPPLEAPHHQHSHVHVQRKPINWTRGELVGQGAFGSVFVAMDNDTGELIAVKQVAVPRGGDAHARKVEANILSVEEEVLLLQQFDHPNIVRYLGTEKNDESLIIFLEYVPGGSIASLLKKFGCFKESVIKVYTKQILVGLEYLHSKGVMHRDIKGANILVDNTGLVKLADFGASKKLEDLVTVADGNKSVKGTAYWMAPEVITQTGHGRPADLWSVACTVLEMATGQPPWSKQYTTQMAAMFHIASSKGMPEIPQNLSPECKDFLYLCFNRDWKLRPSASTLLCHPFLADVTLRSHAGSSNNALAQARRMPPPSIAPLGMNGMAAQFGTPSPLNPSVQPAADATAADGNAAALSPLGHHAARQPQWADPPAQQQQQQAPLARAISRPAGGSRMTSSPVNRSAPSLRASAPVFSGYASVALSQQSSEQFAPAPARQVPAAAAPASSNLRGSRESGSVLTGGSGGAAEAASQQQHLRQSGDSSSAGQEREASSTALPQVLPLPAESLDVPAALTAPEPYTAAKEVPAMAAVLAAQQQPSGDLGMDDMADAAAATPTAAVRRRRPAALDLSLRREAGTPAAAPHSAGASSGTNKSDYNPMEEPSWMQSLESPLPGEGTPTSAITAAVSPEQLPGGLVAQAAADDASSHEAASYVAATPRVLPDGQAVMAAAADVPQAAALPPAAAVAVTPPPPYEQQHPSADHMVWTNEDGDIDALPWDTMGGWSTGSSGQHAAEAQQEHQEEEAQQQEEEGRQPFKQQQEQAKPVADAVDEDVLIRALTRKAQHDVRNSLALFETLSIPALHGLGAPPAKGSSRPQRTMPAVKPAPLVPPVELEPAAESIERKVSAGCGSGGDDSSNGDRERRQALPLQPVAAAGETAGADYGRRRSAAVQHVLSGVRDTASRAPPPAAPLAAAVSGLAGLGFGSGSGGKGGIDRESIWAQELSSELFRVKASTAAGGGGGGVTNRRVSMHGSPIKRPGSIHQ